MNGVCMVIPGCFSRLAEETELKTKPWRQFEFIQT